MQVLDPAGDVARQQANLLITSTILMLLIIIPVMGLTVFFAWRYRASNRDVEHRPDWDHSTSLELVIWSAPLLIIIALGAITWISTHTLDPYRRLGRIAPGQSVPQGAKPLEIDVVALDWKWLFIYPEQGIATVNQLVLPVDREVRFRITASSVMNSFYIPTLAGQIYAMPGMETKLHAVLNKPGTFEGISANYSGAGFSGMHFAVTGTDKAGFARWVQKTRVTGGLLDGPAYLKVAKPSENMPARHWSSVDPKLFDRIVNMCVAHGQPCMSDVMMKDMGGMAMEHGHAAMMGHAHDDGGEPMSGSSGPASENASSHPPAHAGVPTPSMHH
jgi:cytochrome o ubiquinol oxidase subunit 2